MKRSFLEGLELEKDVIDQIMTEYGKDVEKYKADIAVLENEKTTLSDNLTERDTQLEELKASAGNNAELQRQITELQEANKNEVERLTAENKAIRVNAAVEQALLVAKAKNITAAKALLSLEGAELADDGTVKGLSDQISKLKEAEGTAFMFEAEQGATFKGVTPKDGKEGIPPTNNDYQQRYDKAKAEGNQAEAIRIKTEAFENDGIVIL
jgi:hypothetical protein